MPVLLPGPSIRSSPRSSGVVVSRVSSQAHGPKAMGVPYSRLPSERNDGSGRSAPGVRLTKRRAITSGSSRLLVCVRAVVRPRCCTFCCTGRTGVQAGRRLDQRSAIRGATASSSQQYLAAPVFTQEMLIDKTITQTLAVARNCAACVCHGDSTVSRSLR